MSHHKNMIWTDNRYLNSNERRKNVNYLLLDWDWWEILRWKWMHKSWTRQERAVHTFLPQSFETTLPQHYEKYVFWLPWGVKIKEIVKVTSVIIFWVGEVNACNNKYVLCSWQGRNVRWGIRIRNVDKLTYRCASKISLHMGMAACLKVDIPMYFVGYCLTLD